LSKLHGSASKPAGPRHAVLRAVMSEDAVFVNKLGYRKIVMTRPEVYVTRGVLPSVLARPREACENRAWAGPR
jgi:hypothetical protein